MHLSALLLGITELRFDDRTTTITNHIATFESKWNIFRQTTATATIGTDSLAAGVKIFVNTDAWKVTMLLTTLPNITTYQNIINNITSGSDDPTFATVVLRLQELAIKPSSTKRNSNTDPQSAFATSTMFCRYYKRKGFPSTSHNEIDCRTKKHDQNKRGESSHIITTESPVEEATIDEWSTLNYLAATSSSIAPTTSSNIIPTTDEEWHIDSGSTVHITNNIQDLKNPKPWRQSVTTGEGVKYSTYQGIATAGDVIIDNCLYVPEWPKKLISVTRLAKEGWEVSFARDTGIIKKENQESYLERIGGLYKLANQQALYTEIEWHERYGHLPFSAFRYIPEVPQHLRTCNIQCARCIKAKIIKPISYSYGIRTSRVGELLHADLCGLLPV